MKYIKIAWDWLVYSSQDPNKWSLTLKAGVPYVLLLLSWKGLKVEGDALNVFIDVFVNAVVLLVQCGLAIITAYGAYRKIKITSGA